MNKGISVAALNDAEDAETLWATLRDIFDQYQEDLSQLKLAPVSNDVKKYIDQGKELISLYIKILQRINDLKSMLDNCTDNDVEKARLIKRIARLELGLYRIALNAYYHIGVVHGAVSSLLKQSVLT